MFLGIVVRPSSTDSGYVILNEANGAKQHESLDAAKKAVELHISKNKSSYSNGYVVYVIDQDKATIVSTASVPTPSLEWKDVK